MKKKKGQCRFWSCFTNSGQRSKERDKDDLRPVSHTDVRTLMAEKEEKGNITRIVSLFKLNVNLAGLNYNQSFYLIMGIKGPCSFLWPAGCLTVTGDHKGKGNRKNGRKYVSRGQGN